MPKSDQEITIELNHILGIIYLVSTSALLILLELTRRRLVSIKQLSFILCSICLVASVGGLVDQMIRDDQLILILYGIRPPGSSPLTGASSFVYTPVVLAVISTIVFIFKIWSCKCTCCCSFGLRAVSHHLCQFRRIQMYLPTYLVCHIILFTIIGARLNSRLRQSSINPVGGTLHWHILRNPSFFAFNHTISLLLVGLKIFLKHIDQEVSSGLADFYSKSPLNYSQPQQQNVSADREYRHAEQIMRAAAQLQAQAQTIVNLQTQNATQKVALEKNLGKDRKASETRRPYLLPLALESATLSKHKAVRRENPVKFLSSPSRFRNNTHSISATVPELTGGDVSALISSDSENEATQTKPKIVRGKPVMFSTRSSSVKKNIPSTLPNVPQLAEVDVSALISSDSDDNDAASNNLGRFAPDPLPFVVKNIANEKKMINPHEIRSVQKPIYENISFNSSSPHWIECYDDSTRSIYYYCEATGESRWDNPFDHAKWD